LAIGLHSCCSRGPGRTERMCAVTDLAQDLAIDLQEDRPGTLARAVEAIARAGINIEGYAEVEGILHVLTKDALRARRAVEAAGLGVREERTVLLYPIEDRPGALAALLRRIADAGVNVNFSYVAASNRIVLGAGDLAKVREVVEV
jgi:hypothetical protein